MSFYEPILSGPSLQEVKESRKATEGRGLLMSINTAVLNWSLVKKIYCPRPPFSPNVDSTKITMTVSDFPKLMFTLCIRFSPPPKNHLIVFFLKEKIHVCLFCLTKKEFPPSLSKDSLCPRDNLQSSIFAYFVDPMDPTGPFSVIQVGAQLGSRLVGPFRPGAGRRCWRPRAAG